MTPEERDIHKSMLVLLKDATRYQVHDLMLVYGRSVLRIQNIAIRNRGGTG